MDKERFRAILGQLQWSIGVTAKAMHQDERLLRRWASGQNPIDAESAAFLEMLAAHPPPMLAWRAARQRAQKIEGFSR